MHSFPTLKLPFLALINVLDKLDFKELFVFSLVSNRTKDLAIAARRKVSHLSWDLDYLGIEQHRIKVGKDVMQFPMSKTLKEARKTEKLEEWKLNGQLIPMYRTTQRWFIGDRRGRAHCYQLMDMLSKHILKVFRCEDFELWTGRRKLPEDLFVHKHTRKFSILDYSGCNPMPADHLKFVLEQLEVSELLKVGPEVPDFRWSGPLKMNQLIVDDAKWLTFEALMSNECNVLLLDEHIFTGAELNTFLKKWLAGGFPRLEYCSFDGPIEHSIDEVLQGIETMPSNQADHPNNRERNINHPFYEFENEYNNLADGVDIRSNTGVLATIDVDNTFAMAVWDHI